ncbi:4'-phosphopantetheinyl transferase family protein [Chromohalobacter nigrandesensis]|uniref:4'-phosphopantetheinyl transferase family protein n=1 Tax=Chromohalobacter nigrandesensis TaxID=119863 RepID=UPI001FF55C65|nr:4'-phosphopantetheinyl transferase superfamily protein [Chromohalobacter nigrandesensis]MCK0744282.1 4'-phosphopantetheinyl transferase superfamily protein [Chromohalobacter nigrandesensis]
MPAVCDLPAGCQGWQTQWPWPRPLAGVAWRGVDFTAPSVCEADFATRGIALPPQLATAIAKRRGEFLAGRLCAREALHAATGCGEVPGIAADRAPCWPQDTLGSITHSDGFAAALAAPRGAWQGLGLDAETLLSPVRTGRLASEILTPEERAWCDGLDSDAQALFTTLAFSSKESLFKALYPLIGVRFYFQDAALVEWRPATGHITLQLRRTLCDGWAAGATLEGQYTETASRLLSLVAIPSNSIR